MSKEDEIVCYILMRKDLGMSPGKMVAQGGHAVHLMLNELYKIPKPLEINSKHHEWYKWWLQWEDEGITKITLSVNSEDELHGIATNLSFSGYIVSTVIDEGRTEVPENSLTAACLQPMPRRIARQFVGDLRLL